MIELRAAIYARPPERTLGDVALPAREVLALPRPGERARRNPLQLQPSRPPHPAARQRNTTVSKPQARPGEQGIKVTTLGATRTANLPVLRTHMNSAQGHARGHGLF